MDSVRPFPKRKHIRLPHFDYSGVASYSLTICTHHRICFFGTVVDEQMRPGPAGEMVERWWLELEQRYDVMLDEYVVMPNHFHGLLLACNQTGAHAGAPLQQIIRWFKTMSTNDYMRHVKEQGWLPFDRRLWQRNFYEHILRDNVDLVNHQQYIRDNPVHWERDQHNPSFLLS
ncbi:MAG TPA: transposase [bacterium]|jgi:REP element-mobilizing transposase RayT